MTLAIPMPPTSRAIPPRARNRLWSATEASARVVSASAGLVTVTFCGAAGSAVAASTPATAAMLTGLART